MQSYFSKAYSNKAKEISGLISDFDNIGKVLSAGRNTLKLFELDGQTINIKSFKKPNFINKIAYRFFRKSKAQRSFEYANLLLKKGINTPKPIAYFQESLGLFFGRSFYVSKHLECDFTYRELVHDPNFPNRHEVLKQFTNFTFKMHENGIEFLDHSSGNTLIIVNEKNDYDFYLVDLNRMNFHEKMDYETRIKNFSKLTPDKNMVAAMSRRYAELIGEEKEKVFRDMWAETQKFQEKFHRKKRLKKKLKFWKK